jgi:hypothetical protein
MKIENLSSNKSKQKVLDKEIINQSEFKRMNILQNEENL